MRKPILFLLILEILFSFKISAQDINPALQVMDKISPNAIKGHMTFLSDDLLEGRQPGKRGFAIGSKYIESQMIGLGLEPGNGDSYIQEVPFRHAWVDAENSTFQLIDGNITEDLQFGEHFILSPYFNAENSSVKAPLVFVGFGVSAPEFNYDDYKGIDVKGKIVVYINDAPNTFPNSERAYYATGDAKYKEAIKRGAVGAISFMLPSNKRTSWPAMVRRIKSGSFKWLNEKDEAANSYPELKTVALFNNAYLSKLFSKTDITPEQIYDLAEKGTSKSFPLNSSAALSVKTNREKINTNNLIGTITGSDPKLKDEYLVYTAHLDHLGIGNPVEGDSIYNGAHDNASGMSILLEIIKAYKSLPEKPKRSIIFTVVTGEESGLLGSDYFINNPTIKSGKIVANIAMDMPFFFHPILDIVPYGAVHSSLGQQTAQAAEILNLKISPDPFPEQVVFIRSDHYSFIKKGIPALFIKSGFMTVPSDTIDRSKLDVGWRSTHYHTVRDDMNQPFDFNAAAMHVKVNFLIGYLVCNQAVTPHWNPGDFFGNKMKQ